MSAAPDTRPLPPPPRPPDLVVDRRLLIGKLRLFLMEVGRMAVFAAAVIRDLPRVRSYTSEVVRQMAALVMTSALIIWVMEFVVGTMVAIESSYVLQQVGATGYSGALTAIGALRELGPYMWGYILAAQVGCGLVAEIGSMRISDEIDAMEVMGIRSRAYLVGTRLLAAWIVMPFLYIVGLGVMYVAEYLVVVVQLGGVSPGGYGLIFWLFQNPADLVYSLSKIMAMGTVIVLVGCYYGYRARGGPVGVGINTAKSMMVNLVLVHIIGMFGTWLFWGLSPNAPIAN